MDELAEKGRNGDEVEDNDSDFKPEPTLDEVEDDDDDSNFQPEPALVRPSRKIRAIRSKASTTIAPASGKPSSEIKTVRSKASTTTAPTQKIKPKPARRASPLASPQPAKRQKTTKDVPNPNISKSEMKPKPTRTAGLSASSPPTKRRRMVVNFSPPGSEQRTSMTTKQRRELLGDLSILDLRSIERSSGLVKGKGLARLKKAQLVQRLATSSWEVSDKAYELWNQKEIMTRPRVTSRVQEYAIWILTNMSTGEDPTYNDFVGELHQALAHTQDGSRRTAVRGHSSFITLKPPGLVDFPCVIYSAKTMFKVSVEASPDSDLAKTVSNRYTEPARVLVSLSVPVVAIVCNGEMDRLKQLGGWGGHFEISHLCHSRFDLCCC